MASQADIDTVALNLPSWREELAGWDDDKIGTVLDTLDGQIYASVRLFWLERVSDLSAVTDVSEAGSARPLSQTFQHAQQMLKYWDSVAGINATSVGKIKRRYHRHNYGYGIADYGGVYARTD